MKTFQKVLISMVLALSIGVQWPLLQSVAWMNMMITYSQEGDIKGAVAKTFNGKNPCKLCKLVQKGMDAEKDQEKDYNSSGKKFETLFSESDSPVIFPPAFAPVRFTEFSVRIFRTSPPSLPPPKLA